ncbi:MAG: penicillin-binding protein 2 [Alphaproteobacteria bacterium]|nr:penicillin-binding protein 2 [Alphaproteobacteria bacterium]
MAKASDKQRLLSRRAFIFGGVQAVGLTALAARLYQLQFLKSDEYRTLSENNRIRLQLLVPPRGQILDRLGLPLALNETNYQLFCDIAGLSRDAIAHTLERARAAINLPSKRITQALDELRANPYASPLLIAEHLEWEQVAAIELRQLDLPGLYIAIGQLRYYPYGPMCAHLLGYVGAPSPEEVAAEDDAPLLKLPEYRIGKAATERMLEERLRGQAGIRQMEVNVHGQAMRELAVRPAIPGDSVRLAIHHELQEYGANLLAEQSAAAIVLDVRNGDVMALLSVPGFDPNIFSKGIPADYWESLQADNHTPLINKAVQGLYPPGSTFKMMVGLAGLAEGAISPDTRVSCSGHYWLGDHKFNCWKEGGHGSMNLVSAIAQSCDTFFYTVARATGIDAIAAMAKNFGLGATHFGDFPSEKKGLVPDAGWKQKRYRQRWTTGDTINAGIGQGYVLATPLQLAVMVARLSTGRAVEPRLLAEGAAPAFPELDVEAEHLQWIQKGMDAVANTPGGTAYGKRIAEPKYAMAGKTGTSQVRKIITRGVKQESLPWEYRHHALFVGYAPVASPRYACAVAVEHGGGGAAAAAPVARDLLLKVQQLEEA